MRAILFILLASFSISSAGVRIGDLTNYPNTTPVSLTGYGLIVGLAGTGDGSKSTFTPQTFATMLKQFGIEVAPGELKLKNVAAVMVSCEMPAGSRRGSRLDALVSSLGDATSLQGGTLLRTVLADPWGNPIAEVQGPVSIGGFNFETGGTRVSRNHAVAGRIPSGTILFEDGPELPAPSDSIVLMLEQPDLRMAVNITKAINGVFVDAARTEDPSMIVVNVPPMYETQSDRFEFQSAIEDIEVNPDGTDKIVINERTGVVILGEEVRLSRGAITKGNLTVTIAETAEASQPGALSGGDTAELPRTDLKVEEEDRRLSIVNGASTLQEVVEVLNVLGATPRDMVDILQSMSQNGMLHGELVLL